MNYRTVLVDDEPLALKRLGRLLQGFPGVEVVGEAGTVADAVAVTEKEQPDLLFLDIQLPDGEGFDVLRRLEEGPLAPLVIFTTGYDQYALRAFEEASVDYLLKPIETEKLARALQKLGRFSRTDNGQRLEQQILSFMKHWRPDTADPYVRKMTVRVGERSLLIDLSEVTFFEAKDKYVFLHTANKEYIVENTLSELEKRLDPKHFVRVHRSTIVNLDQIQEIQDWFGGKYRLVLRDKVASEIVVSKGMASNLRAVIPF
jgi:two-component system LytT family response regulator